MSAMNPLYVLVFSPGDNFDNFSLHDQSNVRDLKFQVTTKGSTTSFKDLTSKKNFATVDGNIYSSNVKFDNVEMKLGEFLQPNDG